jgi:hypothetical protein
VLFRNQNLLSVNLDFGPCFYRIRGKKIHVKLGILLLSVLRLNFFNDLANISLLLRASAHVIIIERLHSQLYYSEKCYKCIERLRSQLDFITL